LQGNDLRTKSKTGDAKSGAISDGIALLTEALDIISPVERAALLANLRALVDFTV